MNQDATDNLEDLIRDLTSEVGQVYRLLAEQAGINQTDLMSLYFIKNADGDATPKQLAEHLGLTSGATAILLNRLEARGYIQRHPHPTDRRGVILSLGPAARDKEFLHLRNRFMALNSAVLDRFTPEELAIVKRFMSSMLTNTRDSLRQFRHAKEVVERALTDDGAR
jgi:DNA-binding MarR family transcriptional regulator